MSGKHHFIVAAEAADALPPERWRQAFPEGQARPWAALQGVVRSGDIVWVPVTAADWEAHVRAFVRERADVPVVVLSPVPQDAEGLRVLDAGARGYAHLLAVPAVLREVEQVVRHGGLWAGPELVQRLLVATRTLLQRQPAVARPLADLSLLSEREAQVARAVAAGKSNREIAAQLCISERTVKAHLGQVFAKLGVRDRVQLALRLAEAVPAANVPADAGPEVCP